MATSEGRDTTQATQESLFYERCWRCRCVVPNGLVRRRTMKTGYSKGTFIGTGATVADLDHYQAVSLCGVCAEEVRAEERAGLDDEHRQIAWFFRSLGVVIGSVALSYASVATLVSTLTMLALARLRMVGRSLLAMYAVAVLVKVETLPPERYGSRFVLPWALVTSGLVLWRLWRADTLLWPFSWLVPKRPVVGSVAPTRRSQRDQALEANTHETSPPHGTGLRARVVPRYDPGGASSHHSPDRR